MDFSTISKTAARLLGSHSLVWLVWAATRATLKENIILHECVVQHPSELVLDRYLTESGYHLFSHVWCYPYTRRRRFCICISYDILGESCIPQPLPCPSSAFEAKCVATAAIFYGAPQHVLDREIDRLQLRRNMELVIPVHWRDLLGHGDRDRLEAYEKSKRMRLEEDDGDTSPPLQEPHDLTAGFANISENVDYVGNISQTLGCLTRRSMWRSWEARRFLLGYESMRLMGKSEAEMNEQWQAFTDADMRAFAGNGLCVPCVGAAMLQALACVSVD